jgi:hypothetical protein
MQTTRPSITFLNVAENWKSNPRIPIISIDQLRTLLIDLSGGEPGIVNLESTSSGMLQLGVGGPFACALFTTNEDKPHYLCAKSKIIRAVSYVEFLCGGTPTPISPEFCLSFDEAITIAEYFFKKEDRDPTFEWIGTK